MDRSIPPIDLDNKINHAPNVVVLGAGASRACCNEGDKNGAILPVMSDIISITGVKEFLDNNGIETTSDDFEEVYSDLHERQEIRILGEIENLTQQYFEKIAIPDKLTIYDKILLSLREKDVVISFNWDPLLPQAIMRCRQVTNKLPQTIFLHGNVELMVNEEQKKWQFARNLEHCGDHGYVRTPLLYPIKKKNYKTSPFISEQWKSAAFALQEAYEVTIFGYSAPKTDVEAREIFLEAWVRNAIKYNSIFQIIDIAEERHVNETWREFNVNSFHFSVKDDISNNSFFYHPRRSCEAWFWASQQQRPWHEDPFPQIEEFNIALLKKWIHPYIEEENLERFAGKPLCCL
jgi:hypothetical protein